METFFMPVKVISGDGCVVENYSEFSKLGKRAVIVTGRSSARKSGALFDIEDALNKAGVTYTLFDKIENNPSVETVLEGGVFAREFGADFIIACGGGSPLDAGKAIAAAYHGLSRKDLLGGNFSFALPIIAIPTTAGTGSEVTQYSILTDNEDETKVSIAKYDLFPKTAFLDAKYTEALGVADTVNTAIDALSHAVEGYLSNYSTDLSDFIALEAIKIIGKKLPYLNGRLSKKDREDLLYASMISGIVISQTKTTALHKMGYPLTYYKNIPHGRANGLMFGEYLRVLERLGVKKVNDCICAMNIGGVDDFCRIMSDLMKPSGEITAAEAKSYSEGVIKHSVMNYTPGNMTVEDIEYIYTKSFNL
ncbi:MAG: Alcohol dehydrogenase 2 [Firmicutes bacterium ADurb.Bin193]|nr:MAG: Alcohol dehydrogenase 2 [Firmicutes bacterium ADurb.Bin193]